MKILALETATEGCSAALAIDDDCQIRFEIAPKRHTELILPMVDQLLGEAGLGVDDIEAIAFGQGPGAFIGVRLAISVVKGLAFAHNIPVLPVSTLAALAQQFADRHERVATAIDARMQEVYWGLYERDEHGLMRQQIDDSVCTPSTVTVPESGQWFGAGSGWRDHAPILKARLADQLMGFDAMGLPSARDIITLAKPAWLEGKAISAEQAAPVYLRNNVATPKRDRG